MAGISRTQNGWTSQTSAAVAAMQPRCAPNRSAPRRSERSVKPDKSTGDAGSGAGLGYTVNLPVPAGSGDEVFVSLVADVVAPLARAFGPELVLVSAGYDAHLEDPLAGCRVTDDGYGAMASWVRAIAGEAGAPVAVCLEGGYALGALSRGVVATVEALGAERAVEPPGVERHPLAAAALERLAGRWAVR